MSSASTMTGRLGAFQVGGTTVARATQWSVNPNLASQSEWGDSDSEGFTNRASGRRDATFSNEGKYDTGTEFFDLFQLGDIVEPAVLWLGKTTAGLYWHFPRALNQGFTLVTNVDTEEVIGWTGDWGADGRFYRPGEANAPVVAVLA